MQWLLDRRIHTAVPSFWRYITRGTTTLAIPLRWLFCERLEVSLCPLLHSAAPRAWKSIGGNVFRVWRVRVAIVVLLSIIDSQIHMIIN